ncbi:MAG: outer membrane beta-barrel protein [Terracidiphilus sp.]|jgi:outer membrane immunogenic protein
MGISSRAVSVGCDHLKELLFAGVIAVTFIGATALAADTAKVESPLPSAAVSDWSGFYVGAELSAKLADTTWTTTSVVDAGEPIVPDASSPRKYDPVGVRGGMYFGYNHQLAKPWVSGIEVDWADANKTTTKAGIPGCSILCLGDPGPVADTSSVRMGWDSSARARLGYLLTPRLLTYGTGGIAWQKIKSTATCQFSGPDPLCNGVPEAPFATASSSAARIGWTIGVGAESRFAKNWILRGEYRYAGFGTGNVQSNLTDGTGDGFVTNLSYQDKVNTQSATLGIAYRFTRRAHHR